MKALGKFLGVIGQIIAVIMVIALLLNYINGIYGFMPELGDKILHYIVQYGATLLVAVIALSAALKTNMIFTIIVILLILAVIGFMFAQDILMPYLPAGKASTEDAAAVIAAMIA